MVPPAASSIWSKSPYFACFEPMNIKCSNRCANPVRPGFSCADPASYQTLTVSSGTVWSSWRMTRSPFGSVNCVKGTSSRGPAAGPVHPGSRFRRDHIALVSGAASTNRPALRPIGTTSPPRRNPAQCPSFPFGRFHQVRSEQKIALITGHKKNSPQSLKRVFMKKKLLF